MVTSSLFADDTTIVGKARKLEKRVRVVKREMGRWEKRNIEDNEESLEFGTREIVILDS